MAPGSLIAAAVATLLGIGACEVGLRAAHGLPLLPDRNLIAERVALLSVHTANRYDPTLGWLVKPNLADDPGNPHNSVTTGPLGERRHSDAPLGTADAVVAVGDSFTWGSEVGDTESWPAALERLIGTTVVNGSTGGWGSDQIVLRAEQLRDVLHPARVIVSFLDQDILRANFRIYGGGSKPWFTAENRPGWLDPVSGINPRVLVEHNLPVDRYVTVGQGLGTLRGVLGYSHVADALAARLAPAWWLLAPSGYVTVANDPSEVSCLLLRRLSPSLFVLQWGGNEIVAWADRPDYAQRVLDCARAAGIPTLDLWDALKAEWAAGRLETLFVRQADGNPWGHMSPAGNDLVARLVAEALR